MEEQKTELKTCALEIIYDTKPNELCYEERKDLLRARYNAGMALGELYGEKLESAGISLVTGVPESGNPSAMGFTSFMANQNIIYQQVIRKMIDKRYFKEATEEERKRVLNNKFSFDSRNIEGRRIVLVDDSIITGKTIATIVKNHLREECGAKEVHVLSASPAFVKTCPGTKIYENNLEHFLVNGERHYDDICEFLGADSVRFLPEKYLPIYGDKLCNICMGDTDWTK